MTLSTAVCSKHGLLLVIAPVSADFKTGCQHILQGVFVTPEIAKEFSYERDCVTLLLGHGHAQCPLIL